MNEESYYHFSNNKLILDNRKYSQYTINYLKPNGLWLSKNNEWIDWCTENNFFKHDPNNYYKNKIEFSDDIKLYKCTTIPNLLKLCCTNWTEMSFTYDGIIIDNYYNLKDELYKSNNISISFTWFFGLDVNCIYVWNISKLKVVESINKIKK